MIITCPECATRYDLEEERFLPNGRSVRCTACGESWFVPAPEPIDMLSAGEPLPRQTAEAPPAAPERPEPTAQREAIDEGEDLLPPRDEKGRFMPRSARASAHERDEASVAFEDIESFDEDEDDTLFTAPEPKRERVNGAARRSAERDDEETPPKGWRKGKQFFVEDDGEDEDDDEDAAREPIFARRFAKAAERRAPRVEPRASAREGLRFGDEEEDARDVRDQRRATGRRHSDERYADDERFDLEDDEDLDALPGEATIVDADWEDVDGDIAPGRHFGRRIREERRRSTALARMEDVRRFNAEMFDEEFFDSLRVTPRELERAVTKARRRAESRHKNRLTPWRAFGWSAWVAAIAGAAYAVVVYSDEIVKVAPSTADAYAVIGIETDPFGLKIENVRHRLAMSTGGPMIEITGTLRNAADAAVDAPLLQAEALGPRGELLARWTFAPEEGTVAGDGAVPFMTRNAAPEGVAEVALSFAPTESAVNTLAQTDESAQ